MPKCSARNIVLVKLFRHMPSVSEDFHHPNQTSNAKSGRRRRICQQQKGSLVRFVSSVSAVFVVVETIYEHTTEHLLLRFRPSLTSILLFYCLRPVHGFVLYTTEWDREQETFPSSFSSPNEGNHILHGKKRGNGGTMWSYLSNTQGRHRRGCVSSLRCGCWYLLLLLSVCNLGRVFIINVPFIVPFLRWRIILLLGGN